jgi:nitrogen fixation protein NifZ
MMDPEAPKFQWGQPVQAADDLFNDGSYPNLPVDALLVSAGDRGEIVQIGAHVETNTTVYLVEFPGKRIVGCLEGEIADVSTSQAALTTESQVP